MRAAFFRALRFLLVTPLRWLCGRLVHGLVLLALSGPVSFFILWSDYRAIADILHRGQAAEARVVGAWVQFGKYIEQYALDLEWQDARQGRRQVAKLSISPDFARRILQAPGKEDCRHPQECRDILAGKYIAVAPDRVRVRHVLIRYLTEPEAGEPVVLEDRERRQALVFFMQLAVGATVLGFAGTWLVGAYGKMP